jgi:nicotinamide-nucleotide amidase
MKAELISIGTELLLGEITDLNSAYLAAQLPLLGLDLHFISTVGDNKQRLIETLSRAWQRSDIIISTGGLGPTEDDITRESIADFVGEPISIDESLVAQFREMFRRFNMEMPESNIKQASVIPSCEIIANPRGTAPGWWVEKDNHVIVAMPGPPGEMQQMWKNAVSPKIQGKFCTATIFTSALKTFGLSEAKLGEITREFLLARNPTVGIYAKADGVHLRVAAKASRSEEAKSMVSKTVMEIRQLVGEYIWGADSDTLEGVMANLFVAGNITLATAEAGTGGMLANTITNTADSSKFYRCGIVIGRRDLVSEYAGGEGTVSQSGQVSPETALQLAVAARKRQGASVGMGVIGIVDEDPSHKIGTVMIGIDDGKHNHTFSRTVPGTRLQIKQRAANSALFELTKIMLQEIRCTSS